MEIYMKITSIILCLCLLVTFFAACDGGNGGTSLDVSDVDVNFLTVDDPYNTLLGFMTNPDDFQGKSVAVRAESSVIYNFAHNRIDKRVMFSLDPTNCCNAYYEIRTDDGVYPDIGESTVFVGDFTTLGYINVTSFEAVEETIPEYEIDALDMSAEELEDFIEDYTSKYSASEDYGKTIRIFGHCESSNETYKWLLGLNEKGSATWEIELVGDVEYPKVSGNMVNPVEIIGKLSIYEENGIDYACIEVERITKIECVFS